MPRRVRRFWLVAILALGCTPPLTADDALPFQDCASDSDCTFDSLSCSFCSADIAVNIGEQVEFDQMKGCWPPSSEAVDCAFGEFGCSRPVCAAGRCAIANDACQGEFSGTFSGTTGTVDGTTGCVNGTCTIGSGGTTFGGATTANTTGGFGTTTTGAATGVNTTGGATGSPPDGGGATTGSSTTGGTTGSPPDGGGA